MSGDTSLALQTAIFTRLSTNSGLALLATGGVFDSVQDGTQYPYIAIGSDTAVEFDTLTTDGMDTTVTIHSWTQGEGRADVKTIMKAIYDLIHKASLSITGGTLIQIRHEFSTTMLDPDGRTYHGVQRFRALTQGV